jgi:hypothetical protein
MNSCAQLIDHSGRARNLSEGKNVQWNQRLSDGWQNANRGCPQRKSDAVNNFLIYPNPNLNPNLNLNPNPNRNLRLGVRVRVRKSHWEYDFTLMLHKMERVPSP